MSNSAASSNNQSDKMGSDPAEKQEVSNVGAIVGASLGSAAAVGIGAYAFRKPISKALNSIKYMYHAARGNVAKAAEAKNKEIFNLAQRYVQNKKEEINQLAVAMKAEDHALEATRLRKQALILFANNANNEQQEQIMMLTAQNNTNNQKAVTEFWKTFSDKKLAEITTFLDSGPIRKGLKDHKGEIVHILDTSTVPNLGWNNKDAENAYIQAIRTMVNQKLSVNDIVTAERINDIDKADLPAVKAIALKLKTFGIHKISRNNNEIDIRDRNNQPYDLF